MTGQFVGRVAKLFSPSGFASGMVPAEFTTKHVVGFPGRNSFAPILLESWSIIRMD
jgi:hypothetical protein